MLILQLHQEQKFGHYFNQSFIPVSIKKVTAEESEIFKK